MAGLVVAVVILVLATTFVVTRGADDGGTAATTTTETATPLTPEQIARTRLVRAIKPPATLPPGDYTAVCGVLSQQARMPSGATFTDFIDAYRHFDFPAIIAAAPPAARSIFEDLRDTRKDVLAIYDDGNSLLDLDPEDFPQRWLQAMGGALKIALDKCAGQPGGG